MSVTYHGLCAEPWLVTKANEDHAFAQFAELKDAKTFAEVTVKLCGS